MSWNFSIEGIPHQISPKHRLMVNNPNSAFITAKAGFGITSIGHNYLKQNSEALITVLDNYAPPAISVWLCYSSHSYIPARVQMLNRRSIRHFTGESVTDEHLELILKVGAGAVQYDADLRT